MLRYPREPTCRENPLQSCSHRHAELCKSTRGSGHAALGDSARQVVPRAAATLSLADCQWPIRYSHGNSSGRARDPRTRMTSPLRKHGPDVA